MSPFAITFDPYVLHNGTLYWYTCAVPQLNNQNGDLLLSLNLGKN